MQYGLKVPNPAAYPLFHPATPGGMTQAAFEQYRAQLYDYNARLHYGMRGLGTTHGLHPYHPYSHDSLAMLYGKHDPRARFLHEEPKPQQSYIGLIAMAILGHKDKKLVLSDIYQHILDNYPYFRARGPGWRNSIRHNLSLNDCFIKSGRSANGKGHYWAVHPANVDDFSRGDFRRRRAQRKVRKAMGLAVPDEDDSPSPPPSAAPVSWAGSGAGGGGNSSAGALSPGAQSSPPLPEEGQEGGTTPSPSPGQQISSGAIIGMKSAGIISPQQQQQQQGGKKRLFDVESLLAPDTDRQRMSKYVRTSSLDNDSQERDEKDDSKNIQASVKSDDCESDVNVDCESVGSPSPVEVSDESEKSPRASSSSPVGTSPGEGRRVESVSPGVGVGETRSAWSTPNPGAAPAHAGAQWHHRPSAFHSAVSSSAATAWTTLHPHGYPIMSAPYPMPLGTSADSAQRWQETFSRIMARSYDKNLKVQI